MTHRIALLLAGFALAGSAFAQEDVPHTTLRIGGALEVSEPVEGPARLVGGSVVVNAPVNGELHVAGGAIQVGSAAAVAGDAALAGGTIGIDGSIKGKLRAAGGEVRINGLVAGDASIAAGRLELGPAARIEGRLTYRGPELQRDPAAQVIGGVERKAAEWRPHERSLSIRFLHGWIMTAVLMALAALVAAALPGVSDRMARELRERPGVTPLVGFLALASIPVAAVLLMITIIGIPIGILALIAYAFLLLAGFVWVAVVVGGMLLDRVKPETATRTAWRVGAAVLAMLVLAILAHIPLLGGLVKLAALVVGVGMIVTVLYRKSQPAEATPVA